MTFPDAILLFLTGLVAAGVNSIAGGGTFLTFPALLFTGMSPIAANATSSMAVWPGSVTSAWAYRAESGKNKHLIPQLLVTTLIGSLAGAVALLITPVKAFAFMVPWLLLIATLLFTFGPRVSKFFRSQIGRTKHLHKLGKTGTILFQLLIAFYGGYFGGAAGILTVTLFALMGMTNIHEMNALKTIFATASNWIALIVFILAHIIVWPAALSMMAGASIGGYFGAHYGKRLPQKTVRNIMIATGSLMTIYFFLK